MKNITLYRSPNESTLLRDMVETFNRHFKEESPLKRFLISIELDEFGRDDFIYPILKEKREAFKGAWGVILIRSSNKLHTKEFAKELILQLNTLGAGFMGHPVVEVVQDELNMRKWAKNLGITPIEALHENVKNLAERFGTFIPDKKEHLLVIHANNRPHQSNTMAFYREVEKHLNINSLHVEIVKEDVLDCAACGYDVCGYFSELGTCYHKGHFTDVLLEKIKHAGGILILAPNYNDALSAKIMSMINRLSVLYRQGPFYDKYLFALVVSGNSGSDSVAKQLLGALTINKGFRLPPYFYRHAIANDPGEIQKIFKELESIAKDFSDTIVTYME